MILTTFYCFMTGYFFAIMSEEYKWWAAWVMALFWPLLFVFAGVVKMKELVNKK